MFKGQRIEIDEYERANLLSLLYACTHYTSPLHVASNGDWIYQLMHKLGWKGSMMTDWGSPNNTAEDLAKKANAWAAIHERHRLIRERKITDVWEI